ncbi:MAG: YqgE/AlgH family protein [Myxococcales bacterium]|nr:YqgE/AlgH family protein [Myxococcales bacterium]
MASTLAPGFLVATPGLRDPSFKEAVVLLVDHRPEGALGFVVNKPADVSFRSVLRELNLAEDTQPSPDVPVLVGGPVAPHTGWIVYDPNQRAVPEEARIEVDHRVQVSASRAVLEALARSHDGSRHLLVLGYAGWGAGQLDSELRAGSWIPVELDATVVFETPYDKRWAAAFNVLGIDPHRIVGPGLA